MVMTFSEFGRRVAENGSAGTDHGAGSSLYIMGGGVKAGVFGDHPSLTDLDNGDLKYGIDFRSVYGTLIRDWLGVDPSGDHRRRGFPTVGFVAAPQAVSASPCSAARRNTGWRVTIDGGGQVSPGTSGSRAGAVAALACRAG